MKRQTDITVIDAIMGAGKTSYIIDKMNAEAGEMWFGDEDLQFMYITPLLSEVDRIKAACPTLRFQEPQPVNGRKLNHFNTLVAGEANIVSTHQLFMMINQETREQLAESNYTLVIDEETECVKEYEIKKDDIRSLFDAEMVSVDDRQRLRWNYHKWPMYDGRFSEVKSLCDNGNLVMVDDTFLVWEFPVEFLSLFRDVYILTYLFEGSLLSTYLKANGVPYRMKTLDKDRQLVNPDEGHELQAKERLRELVKLVVDPRLNAVGTPRGQENPLSANWFHKDLAKGGKKTRQLKDATYNYFRNHAKGKSAANMWASFKRYSGQLKGKGYAKGWTPSNLRATNDHIEKQNLAYLVNVFIRPRLAQYFHDCGVEPNQDLYALSQMVQWIWRSQIRRDDPINLYVPSERMRELFQAWLHGTPRVIQQAA